MSAAVPLVFLIFRVTVAEPVMVHSERSITARADSNRRTPAGSRIDGERVPKTT
jgi:hypothetical protein